MAAMTYAAFHSAFHRNKDVVRFMTFKNQFGGDELHHNLWAAGKSYGALHRKIQLVEKCCYNTVPDWQVTALRQLIRGKQDWDLV
jgi:hypothetical protein